MGERVGSPLMRALALYAGTAAVLFVAGVVWAVSEHHDVAFCAAVFYYIAAALYVIYGVLSQAASRAQYLLLTIEERRAAFLTQMYFVMVAGLLVATGVAMQLLF